MMDKIDDKDVILVCSIFDKLDSNREGSLSEEALLLEIEHAKSQQASVDAAIKEEEAGTLTDIITNSGQMATRSVFTFTGRIADKVANARRNMSTFVGQFMG